MEIKELQGFKERKIKAKDIFYIKECDKKTCYRFAQKYHYLGTAKFFCVYGYALYYKSEEGDVCVGVASYCNPQGSVALKGWFGMTNDNQSVMELIRLCLDPQLNGTNANSYLLGGSLRMLRKKGIKAVISLADASKHNGAVYQSANFKYYGLSNKKADFYTETGLKDPRMETKEARGVWLERTRKHRYCYLIDKALTPLYTECPPPKQKVDIKPYCCGGSKRVYDRRFGVWYTCPVCTGYIQRLGDTKRVKVQTNETPIDTQLYLFE